MPINDPEPIGRSLRCESCGKDLRVCGNCKFFIREGGFCAESHGEIPPDRERANFCDWFSLNVKLRSQTSGEKTAIDAAGKAKDAFNDLFK